MHNHVERLGQLLSQKANRRALTPALRQFLSGIRKQQTVTASWHPLGFLHYKVGSYGKGGSIRFHIWAPHRRRPQEPNWPIHDHIFALDSHLVTGRLFNNVYAVSATREGPHRLYQVSYDKDESILVATDSIVKCEQRSRDQYGKGDWYTVPKGAYHATEVPDDELTATIVLASDAGEQSPIVVGNNHALPSYRYKRSLCRADEFHDLLEQVAASLEHDAPRKN